MLQYILNTTAIWLLSLVVFDLFLRRESFHSYNRTYLLVTLLLGALLPLWQWQGVSIAPLTTDIKPVAQVIAAKRAIVAEAPPAGAGSIPWLLLVYLLGVGATLLLLIIDVTKLASFYRRGTSSAQHGWTVIETGKEHAPFSFRNTLFVNTIAQYSAEEWNMILQHERRHTALWHMADLTLLQLARIVFWFHPLVYIYQRRVLMLHEYQADSPAAQQPQAYGQFLVEQAILQSAPALSHSFNRSPIKNRIVMLTRHSSKIARIKTMLFLPVVTVCLLCFSKNILSQDKKGSSEPHAKLANVAFTKDAMRNATYKQILSNPEVVCSDPDVKVTGITVSLLPKGKDYLGPYKIEGSKIRGMAMDRLLALQAQKEDTVSIFIEDIMGNKKDKPVALGNLILRIAQ